MTDGAKTPRRIRSLCFICTCFLLLVTLAGCGPSASLPEDVARFKEAGRIENATGSKVPDKKRNGPYQVISGDVLKFNMPTHMRIVSTELSDWMRPSYGRNEMEPFIVRVSDTGSVTMPIVGDVPVRGRTLGEIENTITNAYYPRYIVNPPAVVCQVKTYQGERKRVFTVMGLVNKPGAYPYPADVEYNLTEVLAFAGGLDMVTDPEFVKIYRQDADEKVLDATLRVRDEAFGEAYDFIIRPGDVIVVEHTLGTRINKFLADVLRVSVGADARYSQY